MAESKAKQTDDIAKAKAKMTEALNGASEKK
jgi:hypothetical protein